MDEESGVVYLFREEVELPEIESKAGTPKPKNSTRSRTSNPGFGPTKSLNAGKTTLPAVRGANSVGQRGKGLSYDLQNPVDAAALVEEMRLQDSRGKTLVIDPAGKLQISLGRLGPLPAAFQSTIQVEQVLSHRWDPVAAVNGREFPVNFFKQQYTKVTWVDALSHLNDPALKEKTLSQMGTLFATKECRALYFESDLYPLQTAFNAVVRGWMWQELVPGPQAHKYSAAAVQALHLLMRNRDFMFAVSRFNKYDPTEGAQPMHTQLARMRDQNCTERSLAFVEGLNDAFEKVGKNKREAFAHFGRLCNALLKFNARLRCDDNIARALEAALPVLKRLEQARPDEELALDAIAHLGNKNYSVQSDCVPASFAVVLARLGKPLAAQHVNALIGSNFSRYIARYPIYHTTQAFEGLRTPFGGLKKDTVVVIEAAPKKKAQGQVQWVGWAAAEAFGLKPPSFTPENNWISSPLLPASDEDVFGQMQEPAGQVRGVPWVGRGSRKITIGVTREVETVFFAMVITSKGVGLLKGGDLESIAACLVPGARKQDRDRAGLLQRR